MPRGSCCLVFTMKQKIAHSHGHMGRFTDKHFQKSFKPRNMCQESLEVIVVVVVVGGVLIYGSQVQFAHLSHCEFRTKSKHLRTVEPSCRFNTNANSRTTRMDCWVHPRAASPSSFPASTQPRMRQQSEAGGRPLASLASPLGRGAGAESRRWRRKLGM